MKSWAFMGEPVQNVIDLSLKIDYQKSTPKRLIHSNYITCMCRHIHLNLTSIHLETHSVVDFIVRQCNMVFINGVPCCAISLNGTSRQRPMNVPFLELDLGGISTSLSSNKLLQISDCVFWATLDAYCGARLRMLKCWRTSVVYITHLRKAGVNMVNRSLWRTVKTRLLRTFASKSVICNNLQTKMKSKINN